MRLRKARLMSDDPSSAAFASGWSGNADDLEQVLRLAADPITVQDRDGRLVYANDAAARQVGFASAKEFLAAPIDEIVGRYDLVDEDGRRTTMDALPGRRALRGEPEPEAIVGFRVHGKRELRWSIIQATPVLRDGHVRFVINAFQDITRLKDTRDRLRVLADVGEILATTGEYQSTLQSLAELVVPRLADWCVIDVVEPAGLLRVAVAHPDPEKRRMAEDLQRQYPSEPQGSSGVSQVIRTGETQIVAEVTDEMLESAARDDVHLQLLRGLGIRSAAIVPLVARGTVLGAITLAGAQHGHAFGDEDRPYLEDLGRRAAVAIDNARLMHEANEAIRLRDDFLAMASHDMRTPLQSVLANVQLASRRLIRLDPGPSADRDAMRENLEQAERSTDRLALLVGDLLDTAMLRSGHGLHLEPAPIDVGAIVQRVAAEHQAGTNAHDIQVTGTAGEPITTDPVRLARVLDNLIGNGVKYSPAGGEITVDITSTETEVAISVQDRGIGIPAADLPAIFEPFRRGSNVTTLRGIGLGLSGSRDVLRQLGGDLTVESVEGQGSVFTARLPRGTAPDPG